MYGNERLPGVISSDVYRPEGSIWRGATEATVFRVVPVGGTGTEASAIPLGTIMSEGADGKYAPLAEAGIITSAASLPGARVAVVADSTGKSGATVTENGATVVKDGHVLVGIAGQVDEARLLVGDKAWDDLTDEQRQGLRTQLEAWGLIPVPVAQA